MPIISRSTPLEVFLGRCSVNMLQIYSRTPMRKCDSMQSNFIDITFRHGCSPVNFLHIFRITFSKNTSGGLLLNQGKYNNMIWAKKISALLHINLCKLLFKNAFIVKKEKNKKKAVFILIQNRGTSASVPPSPAPTVLYL